MKRKCFNIMIIFFIFSLFFLIINNPVNATWSIDDLDKEFKRADEISTSASGGTGMEEVQITATAILSNAIAIVQVLGLGIAIIMLSALGIKYMTGSIEEKAQVKKHATIYVVGAIVFFAAEGVLAIVQEFIKKNFVV